MAVFESNTAKDQSEKQQQDRDVEGRQEHRIDHREGREQRGADHHQPSLVAVPKGRDCRHHLFPQRSVIGGAEQDADAEVEAVEDHINEDRHCDDRRPKEREVGGLDRAHCRPPRTAPAIAGPGNAARTSAAGPSRNSR
jgi:hypothetical protein